MRRRQYLIAAGAALGVAGCSSDEEGEDPALDDANGDNSDGRNGNADSDGNQAATRTPRPAGEAEITRTDLITGDSIFGEIPWGLAEVENPTDTAHGQAELQFRFYDSSDNLLATRSGVASRLPPSTTWRYYQRYAQDDRDRVARVETDILNAQPRPRKPLLDELTLPRLEVSADPDAGVTVTGDVSTNEFSGDLMIICQLYDAEGRFRGDITTGKMGLQEGDTIPFEARFIGVRTPQDRQQVTDAEVVFTEL